MCTLAAFAWGVQQVSQNKEDEARTSWDLQRKFKLACWFDREHGMETAPECAAVMFNATTSPAFEHIDNLLKLARDVDLHDRSISVEAEMHAIILSLQHDMKVQLLDEALEIDTITKSYYQALSINEFWLDILILTHSSLIPWLLQAVSLAIAEFTRSRNIRWPGRVWNAMIAFKDSISREMRRVSGTGIPDSRARFSDLSLANKAAWARPLLVSTIVFNLLKWHAMSGYTWGRDYREEWSSTLLHASAILVIQLACLQGFKMKPESYFTFLWFYTSIAMLGWRNARFVNSDHDRRQELLVIR